MRRPPEERRPNHSLNEVYFYFGVDHLATSGYPKPFFQADTLFHHVYHEGGSSLFALLYRSIGTA